MKKTILLALLVFGAVSVNAQKVKVGSDPAVDLSKYKTYTLERVPGANPAIGATIYEAVDSALTAKGLKRVDTDPDLNVVSWAASDSTLVTSNPSWNNSMGSAQGTGIAVSSQSWPITQGMLVVDIADAHTKASVWRGTATHTLKQPTGNPSKDARNVVKPIQKAVEKMFNQFPRPSSR